MNKRTNKDGTCNLLFTRTRTRIRISFTPTHPHTPLNIYAHTHTHTAELLTRIIAITLNWYYRWQNIEKSCWDRFWLILSSFTIITHIDTIFPSVFRQFRVLYTFHCQLTISDVIQGDVDFSCLLFSFYSCYDMLLLLAVATGASVSSQLSLF